MECFWSAFDSRSETHFTHFSWDLDTNIITIKLQLAFSFWVTRVESASGRNSARGNFSTRTRWVLSREKQRTSRLRRTSANFTKFSGTSWDFKELFRFRLTSRLKSHCFPLGFCLNFWTKNKIGRNLYVTNIIMNGRSVCLYPLLLELRSIFCCYLKLVRNNSSVFDIAPLDLSIQNVIIK
jgi:hypothetical protein